MKKLYSRIAAIFLLVVLYCTLFFANDPYGYFKQIDPPQNADTLIGKMLNYRNGEYDAVIIGDSRIAGYDVSELSAVSGLRYANMAYGGCMTKEMVRLLSWCIENQNAPIRKVIIVTSFYNMNTALQQDRVTSSEKIIESPLTYAFSSENASAMLQKLTTTKKSTVEVEKTETTAEEKLQNFDTSKNAMSTYLRQFSYDYSVLSDLRRICDECKEKGIDVQIILPPWWEGYYDLLEEYQLLGISDEYKELLSRHATLYDFENKYCVLNKNYDDFSDYSHFHGETFEAFVKTILYQDASNCKIWNSETLC